MTLSAPTVHGRQSTLVTAVTSLPTARSPAISGERSGLMTGPILASEKSMIFRYPEEKEGWCGS
jgi:hypothetical protein